MRDGARLNQARRFELVCEGERLELSLASAEPLALGVPMTRARTGWNACVRDCEVDRLRAM